MEFRLRSTTLFLGLTATPCFASLRVARTNWTVTLFDEVLFIGFLLGSGLRSLDLVLLRFYCLALDLFAKFEQGNRLRSAPTIAPRGLNWLNQIMRQSGEFSDALIGAYCAATLCKRTQLLKLTRSARRRLAITFY